MRLHFLSAAAWATLAPSALSAFVPLNSLDSEFTVALLKEWDVQTIAKACQKTDACSGQTLIDVADALQQQSDNDHKTSTPIVSEILQASSGADVFKLVQQVAAIRKNNGGAVDESMIQNSMPTRRKLATKEGSGLAITRDEAFISMGADGDVLLMRTGNRELTVDNHLVVNGDTTLNTTTVASMTVQGHLEVDQTISTGFGRITRDFHQYYVRSSSNRNPQYYNMRTTIPVHENVMYRLEIIGYAYGTGNNIDSVTTGYTYWNWDCVNNEDHVDFGDGSIDVYCDNAEEYLVLEFYLADWYYTGLTVSGWFLNPNGNAHDIEVLETLLTTTDDYWASNSRQLGEAEEGAPVEGDAVESDAVESDAALRGLKKEPAETKQRQEGEEEIAEPTKHEETRFSLHGLTDEVAALREELASLRAEVKELSSH